MSHLSRRSLRLALTLALLLQTLLPFVPPLSVSRGTPAAALAANATPRATPTTATPSPSASATPTRTPTPTASPTPTSAKVASATPTAAMAQTPLAGKHAISTGGGRLPVPDQPSNSPSTATVASPAVSPAGTAGGSIRAWGWNPYGQVGDGTTTNRLSPVSVSNLTNVIAVAGGWDHSLGLQEGGTVWAWGADEASQLGASGTATCTMNSQSIPCVLAPVAVAGVSNVIAVSGGERHSVALRSDGTVWTWGDNSCGQLGTGNTTSSMQPVQVQGLSGVIAISAGNDHTLALRSDGTVWAWGLDSNSQLGQATASSICTTYIEESNLSEQSPYIASPVQVVGLSSITAVAGGYDFGVALRSDGTVWSWGSGGSPGNGASSGSATPVEASGPGGTGYLTGITAIAAATRSNNTIAVKSDGTVWDWGANNEGQLGNNSTQSAGTPVQVLGPGGSGYLTNVVGVAADENAVQALKSDGAVWGWGGDYSGSLGDGTTGYTKGKSPCNCWLTPVQALSGTGSGYLTGMTILANGQGQGLAIAPVPAQAVDLPHFGGQVIARRRR